MLPNEKTTRSEVVTIPGEVEALIAAPSRADARPMVEFLKREGINVQLVVSAESAFEEALLHRPSVLFVDDKIPPAGGIELCQRLKGNTRTHFVPTIIYADEVEHGARMRAIAAGADAIFVADTDAQERHTRLWALLRTQAIYRRQEKKQRTQGSAIQERRRWIGSFVHDLQSSIGALQANFDYLTQSVRANGRRVSSEVEECITDTQTVFRQVVRGLRTVLDLERFEAGRIALKETFLLLGESAKVVKEELDWQAGTMGKTIQLDLAEREQPVKGDPDYLKEAVANLVAFAIRQRANRTITIKSASASGLTRLSIVGDNEKIDPETLDKIFEPSSHPSKQVPVGHGLGLAFAKMVVELHGGAIWVEDVPRAGSAFILELKSEGTSPRLRTVE